MQRRGLARGQADDIADAGHRYWGLRPCQTRLAATQLAFRPITKRDRGAVIQENEGGSATRGDIDAGVRDYAGSIAAKITGARKSLIEIERDRTRTAGTDLAYRPDSKGVSVDIAESLPCLT